MNQVPNVLVTDPDGSSRVVDLFSKLANDRNLFITGEIDEEVSNLIIAQMLYLNSKDAGQPIYLYINSPGGDALSGLAIVDVIKSIRAPVYTFCIAACASAAALIFSSGRKGNRYVYKHSRIMIHAVRGMMNGPINEVKINYNLMEELNVDMCEVLSSNTGQTFQKIEQDTYHDRWFKAEDAIAYGLADKIIKNRHNV